MMEYVPKMLNYSEGTDIGKVGLIWESNYHNNFMKLSAK